MPTLLRPARRRQLAAVGLIGAVVLGTVLRFATTSPLWLDEALSVNIAAHPIGQIAEALHHDGHPPLYYWLLHVWMQAFGEGDEAVRALSGVISVVTLPFAWRLADRVGGPRAARTALVLVALSPFAVRYGTEARMYSLVMLMSVLLALALDNVLRRPTWPRAVQVGLLAGLLLWTHYWSLYLLGTIGLLLLVRWWRDPAQRPSTTKAIAGLVLGGALFLPWVPVFLDQLAHTGTPWAIPSRPTQVAQATLADLGGGGFSEALLLGTLLAVFVVAAFTAMGRSDRSDRPEAAPTRALDLRVVAGVAGATMVVGSTVAWVAGSAYASRYGSVVTLFVLIVAACGIVALRPHWLQQALVAAALLLTLAALGHNVRDQRTRADDVAAAILRRAGAGDLVVVCPDQLGPSLTRVLDQDRSKLDVVRYPDLGDPHTVDWRDYEQRNEAADPQEFVAKVIARAGSNPVWVVWNGSYRTFQGQCEAVVNYLSAARGQTPTSKPFLGAFETQQLIRIG